MAEAMSSRKNIDAKDCLNIKSRLNIIVGLKELRESIDNKNFILAVARCRKAAVYFKN